MKACDLANAKAEALRFLRLCEKCEYTKNGTDIIPGKEAAACKRASLDLTRALADLRHPSR